MAETQEKKQPTPYIPWRTFTSFLSNMHGNVPIQIDTSVLKTFSGTARSQLLSALKFLELIEVDGTAKDSLKALADAYNTPEWKRALASFMEIAYRRITGDLDIRAATPAMLRDRFKTFGGVEGGTVEMAVRFYLSGLKEAEVPFSSHLDFKQRAPRAASTRRRQTAPRTDRGKDDDSGLEPPEGTFEIPFTVLGLDGSVFLPEDVSRERWVAISQYVDMVIGFRLKAQGRSE
jgi:hypothetical protein